MRKLTYILLLLMLSGLAFGQTSVPTCDPNNPVNCTDYFGAANWANSPLPAGHISGFTIVSAGSGYVNPVVTITDPAGIGATAGAVTIATGGAIQAIALGAAGSGYIAPQVTIVDVGAGTLAAPGCGAVGQPACGAGALGTAVLAGPFTGGMPKFLDPLPDLKGAIATADTATFPGSDYYEIALVQYQMQMHASLPPTTLRGYVQVPSLSTGCPVNPAPKYLGPVIVAQKNKPVRVKFTNCLPTGAGGNLFIPTDTTYMGASAPYTQNRATLHLHGGATPWISDGTPHQWTVPVGETGGTLRGPSTQDVPDMWFDATGKVIPGCTAPTCATGATNNPGQGSMTFYWTNEQGGRLMFYHDHALGITRLNVYAGEAAGYLLLDPSEEAALAAATVPGTISTAGADLTHLIPLVIQDKTFVPSAGEIAAEDPTWTAGNFGTVPGSVNTGDLWFPHVYVPNQNPNDTGGSNAFGRWDYGPWLLPGAQTTLQAASPASAVTNSCISAAFPNQVIDCPITPNPSGTPEGFMDTPVVNGKAYPVLHVAPAAYRFHILAAGNDRSWNLQLYVADPANANKEVVMVPAQQPVAGSAMPLCTTLTPITNTALFMGLATAILDGSGNPINGTGLPTNCWPNFGAGSQTAGIPIQQTMWAADGRLGGVPDPRQAGPPFIQIGTEGGLLPAPVVIPSMPTGYEANTRSVTITNVSVHGLWLGPAERADAIVDFSAFGGKTLILYNDAPTPAPAVDSRLDYFPGDGDQTPIGGAPNTQPGYGPNTRTLMQIVVDQSAPNTTPFSLAKVQNALPSIFAATQPVPVVPEPSYPPASGAYSVTPNYSLISDANITFVPIGSTVPVTYTGLRKTIQELFTLDYGRMNATLGVELPLTNFLTQTTIPLGYIDPPTEVFKQGETQFWKITHNGVDTHFIHFHLFNVQVINRMAWDGTKRPPDANELGWKDTVRMNPLEDIMVALQPIKPIVPFPVRDSYRLMDVTMPVGSNCPTLTDTSPSPLPCSNFTNVDPTTNIAAQTPNAVVDYGWEYVWHCHILGHEENDMMRPMVFQVPPETPSNLAATTATPPATGLNLSWTDNSASETGFTLQRANDAGFTTNVVNTVVPVPAASQDANGQGITWGGTITANDTAGGPGKFYRVQAFKPDGNYWTPSQITSNWSNTVSAGGPSAGVSPAALTFASTAVGVTSAAQTVTLSNTGTGSMTINSITPAGDFAISSNTCTGSLAGNGTCLIGVTFTPTATGLRSGTLTIINNSANSPATVTLTGTGGVLPLLTITAGSTTKKYGAAVPAIIPSYNPANPVLTTPPTCSTTAVITSPVGIYPTSCTGAVSATNSITYVAGSLAVSKVPLSIWASNASMVVGGPVPAIAPRYVGFVAGDTASTLAIAPNVAPTCTTTATSTSPVGTYPSSCSGAVDGNYTITYHTGTVTVATPVASVSPTSLTFGPLTVPPATSAAQTVTLSSTGAAALTITSIGFTGTNASEFVISSNGCGPTLAVGAKCVIGVAFKPATNGLKSAALTIVSNDPVHSPLNVALTGLGPIAPVGVSVSPASGGGPGPQVFTANFTDANGGTDITNARIVIGNTAAAANSCYVIYSLGKLYLENDTGTAWLGGFSPGNGSSASNLQCTLNGTGSSYTASAYPATTATLAANVTFKPAFAGLKNIYLYATDSTNLSSATPLVGVWNTSNSAPVAGVSPTSLSFPNRALNTTSPAQTVTLSNTGGGALTITSIARTGTNPGDFAISSSSCGSPLNVGANCAIGVTFTPTVGGARPASLTISSNDPVNPTLTVALSGTGAIAPQVGAVSPSSGSGGVASPVTFTATYTDANGGAVITNARILINATAAATNACYVIYSNGKLYLENNAGTAWLGGITPGSGSVVSTQCTLNGAGSSATVLGNTLTLTVSLQFTPSFVGAKGIWLYATDSANLATATVKVGTWTVL